MDASAVFIMVSLLTASLGVVVFIIAADKKRFLARFELNQWRESYYLRALPNFLQALHDHHFKSPFPRHTDAVAASYFRFRTWPLLRIRPRPMKRAFLQQHITLFALLELLRPYIQDFVLHEQQRIVGERVIEMEDTADRDRLIAFIDTVRSYRDGFYKSLTEWDRHTLADMIDRKIIPTLRRAHAIFQEHGYSLLDEFNVLRHWAQLTGAELAQELPAIPAAIGGAARQTPSVKSRT